jgi:Tfp pilus assembly protein PilV
MRIKQRSPSAGYTLIEAVIAAALLSVVIFGLVRFMSKVNPFLQRSLVRQTVGRESRIAMDLIRQYLRNARARTVRISAHDANSQYPNSQIDFAFQTPLPSGATAYQMYLSNGAIYGVEKNPSGGVQPAKVLASHVANLTFTGDTQDPSLVNVSIQVDVPVVTNGKTDNSTIVLPNQTIRMVDVFEPSNANVTQPPDTGVSLVACPSIRAAGGTVTATWSKIQPASPGDWIGLYRSTDANSGQANTVENDWMNTSGSKIPDVAHEYGTKPFLINGPINGAKLIPPNQGVSSGVYQLRLFQQQNAGFSIARATVTVVPPIPLQANATWYTPLDTLTAQWSGIPNPEKSGQLIMVPRDQADEDNTSNIKESRYLDCQQTLPSSKPPRSNTCSFSIPPSAGLGWFELRLVADECTPASRNLLARSKPFEVQQGASLEVSGSYDPCSTVSVKWTNSHATPNDWIGLYKSGAPDLPGNVFSGVWWYVNCSPTPGPVGITQTCNFVLPASLPVNTYVFRLFYNDTYVRLAESNPFGPPAPPPACDGDSNQSPGWVCQTDGNCWTDSSGNLRTPKGDSCNLCCYAGHTTPVFHNCSNNDPTPPSYRTCAGP